MEAALGSSLGVYLGLTVLVMGGCGFMTGQGAAQAWKAEWVVWVYAALLGAADRFLVYSLFKGELMSIGGYLVHTLTILIIALVAFKAARARRMVQQYPWLYVRSGPFSWRERPGNTGG